MGFAPARSSAENDDCKDSLSGRCSVDPSGNALADDREPQARNVTQIATSTKALCSLLTDNEGALLGLVARAQPLTAHQISKMYESSPITNSNASKGTVYPSVKRLKAEGLIQARKVPGDRRGTETLELTKEGHEALRHWILDPRATDLLPEDALRTKVQSFDLLTREERIQWASDIKFQLQQKLEELDAYYRTVALPFRHLVHDNAVRVIKSRMDWLDLVVVSAIGADR